jgi:hypothetical protein
MKLRSRAPTPDGRRGRTLCFSARGARQSTHYGPLQRLLDGDCGLPPTRVMKEFLSGGWSRKRSIRHN